MVTGVNPTGTVTFKNGNTLVGTALLTAGTASVTQTFATVGNYPLTASYSGDANNQASTSAPLTLTVSIEPQVYYIHTDHVDTPRTITDTNGTVVWQWDNTDPFGANMPNENPSGAGQFTFNLRFAGQYYDRETGLNYNVNRDYNPGLGRYIESDPIGLGSGLNTYIYVGGNPLRNVDALGLWATDAHNFFIDKVFENLDPAIRDIIKFGSAYADKPEFQGPEYAFMHAMSSNRLSSDKAKKDICKFIKEQFANADEAKKNNSASYWFYLGMALHPIMDSTSPTYEGLQKWRGVFSGDLAKHGPWPSSLENLAAASRMDKTRRTTQRMRDALNGNFGDCGC
ncbi:MAG TPA: RHS repeat-associated core domain-containing protein [Gallionella sp.]|nr:RHS repeat-associated core domain-containing protein [Gallionella sp.]